MKHYSGIDYDHFLDDIRDMYPFSVEEAVLVELIANSLDAKATLLDIRLDPEQRMFELTDNGTGMDAKGFESYHNFSTSFKRKGMGIGFAGLGAKLALKIADRIITETRQGDVVRRDRNHWSTSEWKFERKGKTVLPVWYDGDERTLPHHGTRVRIYLKRRDSLLLQANEVKQSLLLHYLPILALTEFYESLRVYRRITALINGEVVEAPKLGEQGLSQVKQTVLHRGRSKRPFAFARFELHPSALPEMEQGVGIATFGKIIKRDYFRQYFREMARVTGIIEVPELVECLTTSKCDFRKEGNAGKKYYRFTKVAQQEFRRWLLSLQLIEHTEQTSSKEVQRLQRIVNRIVGEMPDLHQFYGSRSERESLVREEGGEYSGSPIEATSHPEGEQPGISSEEQAIQEALKQAAQTDRVLQEGDMLDATLRIKKAKFGPTINYVEAPERHDISWMQGDTILINTAHSVYRKAVEKKVVEYHNLFAAALAMLREVPTTTEKLELLEKFMSNWGRL